MKQFVLVLMLSIMMVPMNSFAQSEQDSAAVMEKLQKLYEMLQNEDSLKVLQQAFNEAQTIREICGIPFGTEYQKAKDILYNKYGYPDYNPDRTHVVYQNKKYAGMDFGSIHFLFQSDGYKSYMNGAVFIIEADNLAEARKIQEMLYKKLDEKYVMMSDEDENGNTIWKGGLSPTDEMTYGFMIGIMKYDKSLQPKHPYCVRLFYGPYNYVKEEF